MSTTTQHPSNTEAATRQEEHSFLFAQLVLQQSNMAMMLMGKLAHPESGKTVRDVDAARLFIDQLEMLEVKTRGNLSKDEESLLKQTLMSLRLNYVQTIESPQEAQAAPFAPSHPSPEPAKPDVAADSSSPSTEEDEHRKKFSKKY